jgi:hypothetical protein
VWAVDVPAASEAPAAALKMHRKTQAAERLAAGAAYSDRGLVFAGEIGEPLRLPW